MKLPGLCLLLLLVGLPAGASDTTVAFSPNGGATELVVRAIDSAHSSIRMAAYTFTSRPIAQALVDARRRGVDVRLVVDRRQNYRGYTAAHYVENNGIQVRGDSRCTIMHDKFIVVDSQTVEGGSFNYTSAVEYRQRGKCFGVARSQRLLKSIRTSGKGFGMNPLVFEFRDFISLRFATVCLSSS